MKFYNVLGGDFMKSRITKFVVFLVLVVVIFSVWSCFFRDNSNLKTITSMSQLERIYKGKSEKSFIKSALVNVFTMPFSILDLDFSYSYDYGYSDIITNGPVLEDSVNSSTSSSSGSTSSKDYSTTNIQVENVDEADVIKTDGNYIYSISNYNVVITDVRDSKNPKIASKIYCGDDIPEDLLLNNNKLTVISYSSSSTKVSIYNIINKEKPVLLKEYTVYQSYYTSRCIDNKLYVISSGRLKKENDKIKIDYLEDNKQKEIPLSNFKYLEDVNTKVQTIITMVDLDNVKEDISINSYFIDVENAYVSENSIYLFDEKYESSSTPPISSLFGLKGAIGPFLYESSNSGRYTNIYKFNILSSGEIEYSCNNKAKGRIINQYSADEYNGNLRLALYDNDGSRVVVFNEKLEKIGQTDDLAKGETMYSSRFVNNKAYLVTYKTVDPLYVIDLSNEKNPKVLGELKIPGYSTYLHPYDENHIIGIGMETEEVVRRNSSGKVISTTSNIIGMKMALFDVTDVENPKQISSVVIGDRRTTSAILTNPKALLFSKEKELIAIPVNNYNEDFSISLSSNTYSSITSSYVNYSKSYVSEGYIVYNINLKDGIKQKGVITHDVSTYGYINTSQLLRGVYIDNELYTVSQNEVKVNNLDTLEQVSNLKIK